VETKGSGIMQEYRKTLVRVFSFDIKFTGSKRTIFYRKLFGFSSRSKRIDRTGRERVYLQTYPGLLTQMPYLKLGKSVLAVPMATAPRLKAFFQNPAWQPIELHAFDALLPAELKFQAMRETVATSRVGEATLKDEIAALRFIVEHKRVDPDVRERIRRTLRVADELMRLDWSEGREFSNEFRAQLAFLRKALH